MDDAYRLIGTVPKNAREDVQVGLSEFRGVPFVDVRVFADMGHPDRNPTKKGVALQPDRLDALIGVLSDARAELVRRGLLKG